MPDTDPESPQEHPNSMSMNELRSLLQMFLTLGMTVCGGIVLFFVAGWYGDRTLREWGVETKGVLTIVGTIFGVALSFYWSYLRITRHVDTFAGDAPVHTDAGAKVDERD